QCGARPEIICRRVGTIIGVDVEPACSGDLDTIERTILRCRSSDRINTTNCVVENGNGVSARSINTDDDAPRCAACYINGAKSRGGADGVAGGGADIDASGINVDAAPETVCRSAAAGREKSKSANGMALN